jgi:hypothetical protein
MLYTQRHLLVSDVTKNVILILAILFLLITYAWLISTISSYQGRALNRMLDEVLLKVSQGIAMGISVICLAVIGVLIFKAYPHFHSLTEILFAAILEIINTLLIVVMIWIARRSSRSAWLRPSTQ